MVRKYNSREFMRLFFPVVAKVGDRRVNISTYFHDDGIFYKIHLIDAPGMPVPNRLDMSPLLVLDEEEKRDVLDRLRNGESVEKIRKDYTL